MPGALALHAMHHWVAYHAHMSKAGYGTGRSKHKPNGFLSFITRASTSIRFLPFHMESLHGGHDAREYSFAWNVDPRPQSKTGKEN